MVLTIATIGKNETVTYAFQELARYLKQMDASLLLSGRVYEAYDPAVSNVLWLGLDGSVPAGERDEIRIDVKDGAGIITGSSPRAVLMAAYRFLKELGCRFLFPGTDGDVVPSMTLTPAALTVSVHETASYRHRSVCIEGSVGYEHVYNMIDWLPKVGMNGYFVQFHTPGTFFERYYNDEVYDPATTVTNDDVDHIWAALEPEIAKRGLDYHATGHGWTCEPFGIHATSWTKHKDPLPEDTVRFLAEINGERKLWGDVALNTNLCYSNKEARDRMTDAIVAYCQSHPTVNFLHFWLADGTNNHCECAECAKMRPSDYYVKTLNELDEKLTAAGVSTKIVCLIYVDLLWAPEKEKIANPDRFVLMFAPITRSYSSAFTDADLTAKVELAPYVRNKLTMPTRPAENVARLREWQKQLNGDSFDFDYHLMWDHHSDPGYYECARILHKDMANLDKIGLDGMVSCQLQRAAFPTGLPMYAMAAGLWDKTSVFEDVSAEYFTAAFGEDAPAVEAYMATLSRLFDPAYLRGDKPADPEGMTASWQEAKEVIAAFREQYLMTKGEENPSWRYLVYHADIATLFADALIACKGDNPTEEGKKQAREALLAALKQVLPQVHTVFDTNLFGNTALHRYM